MSRRSWPLGCGCSRAGTAAKTTTPTRCRSVSLVHVPRVRTAKIDAATRLCRIVEHRDDLVKTRTQTVNRLHVVLTKLVPAGPGAT